MVYMMEKYLMYVNKLRYHFPMLDSLYLRFYIHTYISYLRKRENVN